SWPRADPRPRGWKWHPQTAWARRAHWPWLQQTDKNLSVAIRISGRATDGARRQNARQNPAKIEIGLFHEVTCLRSWAKQQNIGTLVPVDSEIERCPRID